MADIEQTIGTFATDVTANYDALFVKISATLAAEFDADRLTGDTYGMVVAKSIQSAITAAIDMAKQEVLLDEQEELLQKQITKLVADTSFVGTQEAELIASVKYNNQIKAIDSMGDMIGTMGAGSLVISTDMWAFYFLLIRELVSTRKDYISGWNATTNVPDISATTPTTADFYVVTTAGTINLDGTEVWAIGDIVYYDGFAWRKDISSPSSTTVTKAV